MEQLTVEEANVLDLISSRSKMDCWFWINEDGTAINDLEEGTTLSLYEGISMLNDGLTDLEDYDLSCEEIEIYLKILEKLGI